MTTISSLKKAEKFYFPQGTFLAELTPIMKRQDLKVGTVGVLFSALLFCGLSGCGIGESVKGTKKVQASAENDNSSGLLSIVHGNGQTGETGTLLPLPLVVLAADDSGNPMEGETVQFTVEEGSAELDAPTVLTNEEGTAETAVTLGATPGTVRIRAEWMGSDGMDPDRIVTFVLEATPATTALQRLTYLSGDGQTGVVGTVLPLPIEVRATDAFGDPVEGETVDFTIEAGSAQLSVDAAATDAEGKASVVVTLGTTPGEVRVRAEWTPNPGADMNRIVEFELVAEAGPPADSNFGFIAGAGQCAEIYDPYADPFIVKVEDSFGNPLAGREVTVSISNGTLNDLSDELTLVTNTQGRIQFQAEAGSAVGPVTISAALSGTALTDQIQVTADFDFDFLPTNGGTIQTLRDTPTITHYYTVSVQLIGSCQRPIVGRLVEFETQETDQTFNEYTDSEGWAEHTYNNYNFPSISTLNYHVIARTWDHNSTYTRTFTFLHFQ